LVLLIVGVIDVGLMIYTVMNDGSYTSSLNIFAIVVGALLLRGSARTARVVRWGSVFFCIVFLAALFVWLLITPEALFMTQMKLDMMGAITPFITFILAVVIDAFLFYQLSTPESLQKLEDEAFRNGIPYSAFGLSLIVGGAMIYFLSSMLGGENADHAKQLARNELGNNFAYQVTSLSITESGTVAVVVAYNGNEIRNVEVSW
jgi:hypothetical protein